MELPSLIKNFLSINFTFPKDIKAFEKLINVLCARKQIDNERHRRLTNAQTIVDEQDILQKKAIYNGKELFYMPHLDNLDFDTLGTASIRKYRRQKLALETAIQQMETFTNEEIVGDELNIGFFDKWREQASYIDDETILKFWGRLLAEEVRHEHTVSLRALDILKNISKQEGLIFSNISQYSISNFLPLIEDNLLSENDDMFNFDDILILSEANLINITSVYPGKNSYIIINNMPALRRKNDYIIFEINNIQFIDSLFSSYQLTEAGKALYKVVEIEQIDKNLLEYFAKCIRNNYPECLKAIKAYHSYDDAKNPECQPFCSYEVS